MIALLENTLKVIENLSSIHEKFDVSIPYVQFSKMELLSSIEPWPYQIRLMLTVSPFLHFIIQIVIYQILNPPVYYLQITMQHTAITACVRIEVPKSNNIQQNEINKRKKKLFQ